MNRHLLTGIGLVIANTVFVLVGVLWWGWPLGNVFALLWIENVILTLIAILRLVVYRKMPGGSLKKAIGAGFFMLFFCLGHGGFTAILASESGVRVTFAALGVPAILLIVRYLVELSDPGSRPRHYDESATFAVSRIVMLHVAIIFCWFAMLMGPVWEEDSSTGAATTVQLAVLLTLKAGLEIAFVVLSSRRRALAHADA